ncbi:hypothetical protein [Flavilitoribacter nigricans]|uniref:Uncharacterized protein n=1 Tax=Flavilitoribacter nigricans (strain ATCC 23147 / DSM 23189 / NBRC 102662 / NCIMB 1420 / SS-2) TaxID=1122177 RepID=A0A2D0NCP3_FLAN2|nr:hypothetical protein [Flavilitoribacter nigricans]PHN06168.1 hypothetical protein CRP01_11325 [Flavilitoribacter nigricans DSM 23189 = NBRC 102662]
MKKLLILSIFFFGLLSSLSAQRRMNPAKQLYRAPDSLMVLYSDQNGELQFAYLADLVPPFAADQDTIQVLPDGQYVIIDEGRRDTIDTRADHSQITTTINVDGQTFNAGDVVQDVLIALSRNKGSSCNTTINQADHGFSVGDQLAQDTTGIYFIASSAVADSFPVAVVCSVIDQNTFQTSIDGRMAWTHGLPLYRDYWLQDDGSIGVTPADNPVFAFRTVKADSVDIDVPENVTVGAGIGAGDDWGNQTVVSDETLTGDGTPASPLGVVHDADWLTSGGDPALDINENIYTNGYVAIGSIPRPHNLFVSLASGGNDVRFGDSNKENDLNFVKNISGVWIKNGNDFGSNYAGIFFGGSAGSVAPTNGYLSFFSGGIQTLRLNDGRLVLDNVPDYASDAAADADGGLITGSVYTVTAEDRTLRIKP